MKIKSMFSILVNNGSCIPGEKMPPAPFLCASQSRARSPFLNNQKKFKFKGVCI